MTEATCQNIDWMLWVRLPTWQVHHRADLSQSWKRSTKTNRHPPFSWTLSVRLQSWQVHHRPYLHTKPNPGKYPRKTSRNPTMLPFDGLIRDRVFAAMSKLEISAKLLRRWAIPAAPSKNGMDRFFEKLFDTLRFCQKSAESKSPKKYFLYFILMSSLGLEPRLYI